MDMSEKLLESGTVKNDSKSLDEMGMEIVEVDMGIQKPCPHSQSPISEKATGLMHMSEKPWESTAVINDSKSLDEVGMEIVEVDMGIQKPCPNSQSPISNNNEEPQTPNELGSKGSSVFDGFNYVSASESLGARAPSKSKSRQRSEASEIGRRSSVKRRLVFPASEKSSVDSPTMPQKNPTLLGPNLGDIPAPISTERSSISFTGSNKRGKIKPSSVADIRKWLR